MSTLLKMQKFHPLCSRCIGMYPLQNRWTVLRYLQCYENFSECCTHLILPETALFSPTPTFAKEPINILVMLDVPLNPPFSAVIDAQHFYGRVEAGYAVFHVEVIIEQVHAGEHLVKSHNPLTTCVLHLEYRTLVISADHTDIIAHFMGIREHVPSACCRYHKNRPLPEKTFPTFLLLHGQADNSLQSFLPPYAIYAYSSWK